jgi:hypothetical protein
MNKKQTNKKEDEGHDEHHLDVGMAWMIAQALSPRHTE